MFWLKWKVRHCWRQSEQTILETAIFEHQFIIVNISMMLRRIISKIRIEIRCLFMLLNDN